MKWFAVSAVALLVGCGSLNDIKPGDTLAAVENRFGKPTTTCRLDDGQQRFVWSQQPFGQYAWGANVNSQGQITSIEQVLDDKVFEKLADGVWTPERVMCEFGPPEEITKVGLPSDLKIVWSYRYRQFGVWYSLMNVFFGTDGKQVTQFFAGPDPMFMMNNDLSRH